MKEITIKIINGAAQSKEYVISGNQNSYQLKFDGIPTNWNTLRKFVVFDRGDNVYTVELKNTDFTNNTVLIPSEILLNQHSFYVGMFATNMSSTSPYRETFEPVFIKMKKGSYYPDGVTPEAPTRNVFEQYIVEIEKTIAEKEEEIAGEVKTQVEADLMPILNSKAKQSDLTQEISDRTSGDDTTLSSAKSYTDTKVAAIDLSPYATKTELGTKANKNGDNAIDFKAKKLNLSGKLSSIGEAYFSGSITTEVDVCIDNRGTITHKLSEKANSSDVYDKATIDSKLAEAGKVTDVKVNGSSIVDSNKVANIDLSGKSNATNLENGTGQYSIQQPLSEETFEFKDNLYLENEDKGVLALGALTKHSVALQGRSRVSGKKGFAIGTGTISAGDYSSAEGISTYAKGTGSHAEGFRTAAKGSHAHAEGSQALASGSSAHAEGQNTKALGRSSHTEGLYTIASGNDQHVQGKFNEIDDNNQFAHIVGGGTSDNNRKNIHTLDWSGNAVYSGSVTATDFIAGSNKLSDKANKSTTLSGYGIENAYTKTEVDAMVSAVYKYVGTKTVAEINALDKSTLKTGDTYNISDSGTIDNITVKASDNITWIKIFDTSPYGYWDKLSSEVDLSGYYTKAETETMVFSALADEVQTRENADVTNLATSKSYTDTKISDLNITQYATKNEVSKKANSADVYDKTTIDTKLADAGKVTDVKVNGTSVVTDKVANIDISGKADASALTTHTGNTTVHITDTERTSWNAKAEKPKMATTLPETWALDTEYYLGEQSTISITLPTAESGNYIYISFKSPTATATAFTVSGTYTGQIPTAITTGKTYELMFLYNGSTWVAQYLEY